MLFGCKSLQYYNDRNRKCHYTNPRVHSHTYKRSTDNQKTTGTMQAWCTVQSTVAAMINKLHKIPPEAIWRHRSLKRSGIDQITCYTKHDFYHHGHQVTAIWIRIRLENHQRINSDQRKPEAIRQYRPWKKRNLRIHWTFYIMDPPLKKLASEIQQDLKKSRIACTNTNFLNIHLFSPSIFYIQYIFFHELIIQYVWT